MNIFKILRDALISLEKHEKDYSNEYKNGYRDAICSIEDKIKDNVNIRIEDN